MTVTAASACRLVAVLACAGTAAACGPDLPADLTWESEHFTYKARKAETDACPDIVGGLEEHFSVMQQALAFPWPAGRKVTYYKFLDDADVRDNSECGVGIACTNDSSVESSVAFDGHELVHAYLRPSGYPPWLLLEGAAVALSCQTDLYSRPTIAWQTAFGLDHDGPSRGDLYGAGVWLSGFLLRSRPAAAFLDLYGRAEHGLTAAAFGALFQDVYGEPLDSVWAAATSEARAPVICPWECSRPAAPVDGVTPLPTASTCGFLAMRTFDLARDSELVAALAGDGVFAIGGCGDGTLPPRTIWTSALGTSFGLYGLAPGRYFVAPSPGATLTLAAHPAQTWATSTCPAQSAQPPWADMRGQLYIALPRGSWQVALGWSAPQSVRAYPLSAATAPDASVCPACDAAPAMCTAVGLGQPFTGTVDGTRSLRLTVAPPAGGPELAEFSLIAP